MKKEETIEDGEINSDSQGSQSRREDEMLEIFCEAKPNRSRTLGL